MDEERIIGREIREEDFDEVNLRPKRLNEYIGQEKVKENLSVFIEAAKARSEGYRPWRSRG